MAAPDISYPVLSIMVAIRHMWLFKFKFKLIQINLKYYLFILALFQVLNGHMWMVVTVSDSTVTESFHYCRKFFRTALLCPSNLGYKHVCLSRHNKSPTVCLLTRQFKGTLLYSDIHSFNKYLLTTCYISWLCFPIGHVDSCGFRFQRT